VDKVPLLGDVPIVGNLFKNTVRSSTKTELLIFLTPKVVSDRVTAAAQ
jgi:type IV pilus assembly protein PilQ